MEEMWTGTCASVVYLLLKSEQESEHSTKPNLIMFQF